VEEVVRERGGEGGGGGGGNKRMIDYHNKALKYRNIL